MLLSTQEERQESQEQKREGSVVSQAVSSCCFWLCCGASVFLMYPGIVHVTPLEVGCMCVRGALTGVITRYQILGFDDNYTTFTIVYMAWIHI